ncbi:hypothetical protein WICMUC_003389 [Wickerhamomyces mucosus]|uniref:30 kDa heat shock protein n=1 Tax=Wickerhamomyces mucosus TaxID=1378264 RepID=A0A9P8PLY6_9ASCO|nr:hypothetical protein WICMUC_003389 [Wickerhamomyces mucosus]
MTGNQAVFINAGDSVGISLGSKGSDWLFTVFSIFGVSSIVHSVFYIIYHNNNKTKALLLAAPIISTFVLSIGYFTWASNLGWTEIEVEFNGPSGDHTFSEDGLRAIFYVKYVSWVLSYIPILVFFELANQYKSVSSSFDLIEVFNHTFLQTTSFGASLILLLIGSLVHSTYKWGYFTFSTVAAFFGIGLLINRQIITNTNTTLISNYVSIPLFSLIYILVLLNFGLSDGGNILDSNQESYFNGILDLFQFVIIPFVVLYDSIKHAGVDLYSAGLKKNQDLEKQVGEEPVRISDETNVHEEAH